MAQAMYQAYQFGFIEPAHIAQAHIVFGQEWIVAPMGVEGI